MATKPARIIKQKRKPSSKIQDKLQILEQVAGLLDDLSPEEMKKFLDSAQRRSLFKKSSRSWQNIS